MPYLSGKSIMPVYKFPVNNEATPQTRTQGYNYKVFHPLRTSVNHLSYGCCISIIRNNNRQVGMPVENICKRNYTFPGKTSSIFYCSFIDIPHWSTYTVSYQIGTISQFLKRNLYLFIQCSYKNLNFIIVGGFYPVLTKNIAVSVYKTKNRVCTSD